MLNKLEMLNYKARNIEQVNALGGMVKVKGMTAAQRDLFEQRMANLKPIEPGVKENLRAQFLVHHIVDDFNELIFTPDDVKKVGDLCATEIDKIFEACQRVSGFSDADEVELKKK